MVGSGKVIMRYVLDEADRTRHEAQGKRWAVRSLECFEEARMAGMDDEWWGDVTDTITTHDDLELVSNLFGNMFSVFNFMPFYCAMISTWGGYRTDENDANA